MKVNSNEKTNQKPQTAEWLSPWLRLRLTATNSVQAASGTTLTGEEAYSWWVFDRYTYKHAVSGRSVITRRCEPWGVSRSVKQIYYMHTWSQPAKKQKRCREILVHSSSLVLWYRSLAQGSFKASCNTKGKANKARVWGEEFWNAPLVFVSKWSLPGAPVDSWNTTTCPWL